MLLKQKIKNISQSKIKEENSCFVMCINSIKIEFVFARENDKVQRSNSKSQR